MLHMINWSTTATDRQTTLAQFSTKMVFYKISLILPQPGVDLSFKSGAFCFPTSLHVHIKQFVSRLEEKALTTYWDQHFRLVAMTSGLSKCIPGGNSTIYQNDQVISQSCYRSGKRFCPLLLNQSVNVYTISTYSCWHCLQTARWNKGTN